MSYVASQELCDQLFELAGWAYDIHEDESGYSLGYLLRKLVDEYGGHISVAYHAELKLPAALSQWNGKYVAFTAYMKQGDYPIADTPEDAAAKLCVALFKSGVLQKGASDAPIS